VRAPSEARLRLLQRLTDCPRAASRALMWGTLLAVWTVAGVTVKTAKSLGISSVRAALAARTRADADAVRARRWTT